MTFGFRTDIGTLRPPRRLPDGRVITDAHITKAGVFEYADATMPGGIRRELRESREVMDQAALDSFALVPVTNKHPPVMLDANNTKRYAVGATGEKVTKDDDHVRATVMVHDADTIAALEKGDVEVSCGYACEVDETPGVHPLWGKYDAVQKNIRGNHLAVAVGTARAGRTARVRMDSELTSEERKAMRMDKAFTLASKSDVKSAIANFAKHAEDMSDDDRKDAVKAVAAAAKKHGLDAKGFLDKHGSTEDKKDWGDYMDAQKSKGKPSPSDDNDNDGDGDGHMDAKQQDKYDADIRALGAANENLKTRADTAERSAKEHLSRADKAEGQIIVLQKRIDTMTAELAERASATETAVISDLKARLDEKEAMINRFDETLEKKVRGRAKLEREASIVLGNEFRMDDLNNRQIRVAAIKRMDSSIDVSESVPKDAIKGIFNALVAQKMKTAQSTARISAVVAETLKETPRVDAVQEREDSSRNAWRKPNASKYVNEKGA